MKFWIMYKRYSEKNFFNINTTTPRIHSQIFRYRYSYFRTYNFHITLSAVKFLPKRVNRQISDQIYPLLVFIMVIWAINM